MLTTYLYYFSFTISWFMAFKCSTIAENTVQKEFICKMKTGYVGGHKYLTILELYCFIKCSSFRERLLLIFLLQSDLMFCILQFLKVNLLVCIKWCFDLPLKSTLTYSIEGCTNWKISADIWSADIDIWYLIPYQNIFTNGKWKIKIEC